jgi:endonuclease/exonuclease/phosphatase (EEP) superfamily protein YafD
VTRSRFFWPRLLLGGFAGVLAVVALPVTLARLAGGSAATPLPQLAAFATWGVAMWGAVALGFLICRWWRPLVVVAVALVLHVWWLVPPQDARTVAAGVDAPGRVPIRVLTVNVEYGQGDADVVARWVRERRVDIVAVEELTPEFAQRLGALVGGLLPHTELRPEAWSPAGTGIWSRWPIRSRALLPTAGFHNPQVVVQVPGTQAITVTAVHPVPPTADRVEAWEADLRVLAGVAGEVPGPHIMLGDFNASRDHSAFRDVLAAGLTDSADAAATVARPGFTWPVENSRLPPFVRIDHVLVTADAFAVAGVDVLDLPGSDHRGVFAELALG